MNPIAKQNLNRLINHNVLLVTMVIISCLQVYNYIRLNKVSCIFIFLVTFILSYQAVSKNITISLFLAIFVANFLLGCTSFMEGHTVMVHTPFPHDHKDPIDTKMIPGFDKGTSSSGASIGAGIGKVFSKHIINPSFNQSTEGKCMAATKCTNSSYDCDWCVAGCCDCSCVKQKKESAVAVPNGLRKEYEAHYNNTPTLLDNHPTLQNYLGNVFDDVNDTNRPTQGYGNSYENTSTQGYCLASSNCGAWHYKSKCCVAGCCDTECAKKNCNLN